MKKIIAIIMSVVMCASLAIVAFAAENKILTSVSLFDIYTGDKIPEGKKQYALSFILLDTQKTLTDKVIEKTMTKIQTAIEQQLKATLR